jgi:hypothetical protein
MGIKATRNKTNISPLILPDTLATIVKGKAIT